MAIQRRKKIKTVIVDNRTDPNIQVRTVKPIRILKVDNTDKKSKYH